MTRGRVLPALIIGALAVAGCSGGSGSKDPLAGYYADSPTAVPITFDARPLWSGSAAGVMERVDQAEFRGDVAILSGDDARDSVWAAVDAGTGKVLWSYHRADPAARSLRGGGMPEAEASFQIVGGTDDWKVVIPYYLQCTNASRCPSEIPGSSLEYGLVALSGKDGSVLWQTPIAGGTVRTEKPSYDFLLGAALVGGDNHTVVADVTADSHLTMDERETVAVNTDDGTVRWRHPHTQAVLTAGGTVFQAPGNQDDTTTPAGTETAVDLMTGATLWSLPPSQTAALGAGGTVLTEQGADLAEENDMTQAPKPPNVMTGGSFLDAATGKKIADLPQLGGFYRCTPDPASVIYCQLGPGIDGTYNGRQPAFTRPLLTYSDTDHRIRVSKRDVTCGGSSRYPDHADQDHIYCSQSSQPSQVLELDRSGNVLASGLPGHVLAISDHYAVVGTDDDYPMSAFAVYHVA